MARGRKKVSTSSLDAKIEQQKAVMEKAKLRYEAGKTKAVHTYIGYEGDGFVCVAHSEGLDHPGVIYSYSSHVRMLNANLPYLLDCFWSNVKQ